MNQASLPNLFNFTKEELNLPLYNDNIYNEEDEDIYLVDSNNLNARDVLLPKLTVKKTVKFTENQGILFIIIILILSYIYFLYVF